MKMQTRRIIEGLPSWLSLLFMCAWMVVALAPQHASSFVVQPFAQRRIPTSVPTTTTTGHPKSTVVVVLNAGGFEYEDPVESYDQGVENPYKNPDLIKSSDGGDSGLKIDPARLLGPRLQGSNLYFIGMMGCGKTAVAQIVARRMGSYTFLDTDDIIEKAAKMTIPEIFDQEGEEEFRKIESQVLDSVHPYVRCVISTGGGIVCRRENWSKLQTGVVIWLDVDPEIIIKRIEGTDRPLLQTEDPLQKLKDILDERRDRYASADVRIEVTEEMTEDEVAELVVRELHEHIDNNPPAWKTAKAKAQADGLDWVK